MTKIEQIFNVLCGTKTVLFKCKKEVGQENAIVQFFFMSNRRQTFSR